MSVIIDTEAKNRSLSESSDTELDPQFKPIVTLPEVEIRTNEENEIVLLKLRAKLYRFDKSSKPPEWKERGTGEMKILQHKERNSVRIVMRRDKTFKVCANHFITPWMTLEPCKGTEKAFIYTAAADFADEEAKRECFAIKFGSVDNADTFKSKFEEAKKILKESECSELICPPKSSSANTEDVTTKLDKLEVSNKEEEKK